MSDLTAAINALADSQGTEELISTAPSDPAGLGPEAVTFARDLFALVRRAVAEHNLSPGEAALVEYGARDVIRSLSAVINERKPEADETPHNYLHRQVAQAQQYAFARKDAERFVGNSVN